MPAVLSSSSVKPRPSLILLLYFCVGQWTRGLSAPPAGRGAAAAAFSLRLSRLNFFWTGCPNQHFTRLCHFLWKCWLGMMLLCLTILTNYTRDGEHAGVRMEMEAPSKTTQNFWGGLEARKGGGVLSVRFQIEILFATLFHVDSSHSSRAPSLDLLLSLKFLIRAKTILPKNSPNPGGLFPPSL
jgi:hypothetical protein